MASRSLLKRLWYDLLHLLCRLAAVFVFRVRCGGRELVPTEGGALILANHQSHLDPIFIGLACDRRLNYLARQSLFGNAALGWLIHSLDAIPIDREGAGLAGLKETLKRLRRAEMVLIFPEGTRTSDGEVAPLKPGFCALAKRAGVPLVPAAIEGAFEAWPRSSSLPKPAVIHVRFGAPLGPAEIAKLSERELLHEIERRIRACHGTARADRQRATLAAHGSGLAHGNGTIE